jgi:hypothetical protein
VLLSSPSAFQRNRLSWTGNPVGMAERDQPDLDRVREALREHDERREVEERDPPEPPREDEQQGDDDEDG